MSFSDFVRPAFINGSFIQDLCLVKQKIIFYYMGIFSSQDSREKDNKMSEKLVKQKIVVSHYKGQKKLFRLKNQRIYRKISGTRRGFIMKNIKSTLILDLTDESGCLQSVIKNLDIQGSARKFRK